MQKILVDLRKHAASLHESYFPFGDLVVSEQYVLKDGRRITLNDGDHRQQVKLTSSDGRLITRLEQGGFTVEASQGGGGYTTTRTLTDDTVHNEVVGREARALEWAIKMIKQLIDDAPGIVGIEDETEEV